MRHHYSSYSDEMLILSIMMLVVVTVGSYLYITIHRMANVRPEPIDDAVACLACGSTTDRWDVAPGVYACLCGYEGGPGMRAYQWTKQTQALAKLSPEKRAARRTKYAKHARALLDRVPTVLSGMDAHLVTAVATFTMTRDGERAAERAYSAAASVTREARTLIHEALTDAELARHLATGAEPMDDWRKRVDGGPGTMWGFGPEVEASIRAERRRIEALVKELLELL